MHDYRGAVITDVGDSANTRYQAVLAPKAARELTERRPTDAEISSRAQRPLIT